MNYRQLYTADKTNNNRIAQPKSVFTQRRLKLEKMAAEQRGRTDVKKAAPKIEYGQGELGFHLNI